MDLRTTARGSAALVAAAALLAVLTACGSDPAPAAQPPKTSAPASSSPAPPSTSVPDREPHTLVLNATGEGQLTQIKYTLDGEAKQTGEVKLPWRQSLTVPADGKPHQWTLEISYSGGTKGTVGTVDMFSIVDGKEGIHTGAGSAGSPGSHISGSASVGGTVQG
ncbi:hypothetical protein ACWEOE_30815 [Amycolatopsis sp. NPDC004368]